MLARALDWARAAREAVKRLGIDTSPRGFRDRPPRGRPGVQHGEGHRRRIGRAPRGSRAARAEGDAGRVATLLGRRL